jgi:amino acid adenylation domain-containing protein
MISMLNLQTQALPSSITIKFNKEDGRKYNNSVIINGTQVEFEFVISTVLLKHYIIKTKELSVGTTGEAGIITDLTANTIAQLIANQAKNHPNAIAILAPNCPPLTYQQLYTQVIVIHHQLSVLGLRRGDRIAIVLPNGPEMAVAFLAIATYASSAPLNPNYRAPEFDFYLQDLAAKALVILAGMDSSATAIAQSYQIPIIELVPNRTEGAGLFQLQAAGNLVAATKIASSNDQVPTDEDIALILHTSGTTSRPKMVPLTQINLCVSARHICSSLALAASDRCLNIMPLFHIHGLIAATLASLSAGGSVICTPGLEAERFLHWLAEFQPTWYTAVPTLHQTILAVAQAVQPVVSSHLRFIRSSSAALPPRVMATLEQVFQVPVIEAYGMTEASHQMTSNPLPPQPRKPRSVGIAAGPAVAIMDAAGNFLAATQIGEVVIQGLNVTSGYLNNSQANQSAFSQGWFRTGDQGYLDDDGYLFLTGRLKELINRGGEKIAPREVDEVLLDHPAIAHAVTFALPHPTLGEDVAAAVVCQPGQSVSEAELRAFVAQHLADFKVPCQVVMLPELPKGPTGKLQRIGLAEQLAEHLKSIYIAPESAIAQALASIWQEVLHLERIGIDDNFFAIGGDSLRASLMISRVQTQLQRQLSLQDCFQLPTLRDLAAHLEQISPEIQAKTRWEWHEASNSETLASQDLQSDRNATTAPLSLAQRRLWFLAQLQPESPAYNVVHAMSIQGTLQTDILQLVVDAIAERHVSLRTVIIEQDGQPLQQIQPHQPITIQYQDWRSQAVSSEKSKDKLHDKLQQYLQAEVQRLFDLRQGPLWQVTLLQQSTSEFILLLVFHHLIIDDWAIAVFWREFRLLYSAFFNLGSTLCLPSPPNLRDPHDPQLVMSGVRAKMISNPWAIHPQAPLAVQYTDYSRWQQQWLQTGEYQAQLDYWQRQLQDIPPLLELPSDRSRPALPSYRGDQQYFRLSAQLTTALKILGQGQGATLFMTLLAAFQILLYRYTQQTDIVVGSPAANRYPRESEDLIGFFVSTLVLRTDLSGQPTFLQVLQRVKQVTLGAYSHADLPFEQLVMALQPERSLSYNPLFQVMFSLQNIPQFEEPADWVSLNLQMSPLVVATSVAKFDLTLELTETAGELHGYFEYSTDLFDTERIIRMIGHWQTLLAGIVANPKQSITTLPLLTASERQQLLIDWNQTQADYPRSLGIHQLFAAQSAQSPDAIAVECAGKTLTYRQLDQQANQLAHTLLTLGVKPEVRVGICVERSIAMVIGLLGILKAGGAYVPLDPNYPQDRLAFILQDAQVPIVLTQEHLQSSLPAYSGQVICLDALPEPGVTPALPDPEIPITDDHLAYVIYTSGSTGEPKGVLGLHRGIINRCTWMWRTFPFAAAERCCQKTSLSFVDSVWEIFGPLCQGIPLVVIPDAVLKDVVAFQRSLANNRITRIMLVPSLLRVLLNACADLQQQLPVLKYWVTSGEALDLDLCQQFHHQLPAAILLNLYGSSEVSADVTGYQSVAEQLLAVVPIGRAIANTQLYVLDSNLQPLPIGIPGELWVGGDGLARGYHNRSDLTLARFISNPLSDSPMTELGSRQHRLFKTGDWVRYRTDGNLEFLGRLDHQVKLRGFRIELAEVETALTQHPALQQAVVQLQAWTTSEKQLIAYVVENVNATVTDAELRQFLSLRLPDYMLPAAFVKLDALPLNPNGKVDRQALPLPIAGNATSGGSSATPTTPLEQQLLHIWQQILGVEGLGIDDNFFAIGGHSLLVMQLFAQIYQQLGRTLPPMILFQAPTIRQLAQQLQPEFAIAAPQPSVYTFQVGKNKPPLICFPAAGNNLLYCRVLARYLNPNQPIYGIREPNLQNVPLRVQTVISYYLEELLSFQPQGPYYLAGYSFGGILAYEVAQHLCQRGHQVALLALLEPAHPMGLNWLRQRLQALQQLEHYTNLSIFLRNIEYHLSNLSALSLPNQVSYINQRLQQRLFKRKSLKKRTVEQQLALSKIHGQDSMQPDRDSYSLTEALAVEASTIEWSSIEPVHMSTPIAAADIDDPQRFWVYTQAMLEYFPQSYSRPLQLFLSQATEQDIGRWNNWRKLAQGGLKRYSVSGDHFTIFDSPHIDTLAEQLTLCLETEFATLSNAADVENASKTEAR